MPYLQPLPATRTLKRVAATVRTFPASRQQAIRAAQRYGLSNKTVINFLHLLPPNVAFRDRNDFVERCTELEKLIRHLRNKPFGLTRRPHG